MRYWLNEYIKKSMRKFGPNPYYGIRPGYTYDCWLKTIVVKLETILDKHMLYYFIIKEVV